MPLLDDHQTSTPTSPPKRWGYYASWYLFWVLLLGFTYTFAKDNGFATALFLLTVVFVPKITFNTSPLTMPLASRLGVFLYSFYIGGFLISTWAFRIINLNIQGDIIFWDWWQISLLHCFCLAIGLLPMFIHIVLMKHRILIRKQRYRNT
ncbi:MAG: hypothetical protein GY810_06380 [Aureispira sp.]|nr:hypothetical protein [Aureispira sp.]